MQTKMTRLMTLLGAASLLTATTALPLADSVSATSGPATLAEANAAMDGNLANLRQQASDLSGQVAEVNGQIAKIEADLAALAPLLEQKQQILLQSIKEAYIHGDTSSFDVIAGNENLSGMLGQQQYQDEISAKTEKAASELQAVKSELNTKLAEANSKKEGLVALQGQLGDKIATAEAQEQAKQALAEATLNREEEYQKILATQGAQEIDGVVGNSSTRPASFVVNSPAPTSGGGGSAAGLTGSIGYARAGGNCVNEPGVKNPGYGNPIDWPVLTQSPYIGATALWTYNHTGVVTGIWSNGDIEVRHQNYWGGQHRFPRSAFRGFR